MDELSGARARPDGSVGRRRLVEQIVGLEQDFHGKLPREHLDERGLLEGRERGVVEGHEVIGKQRQLLRVERRTIGRTLAEEDVVRVAVVPLYF